MRTNLALSNISFNRARAALSVAGIGVAIILMFMQLGFRGAIENTATTIYSKMDFDLLVRSPNYLHFVLPDQIPRSVIHEIAGQDQIASVTPFHVSMANWKNPYKNQVRGVVVIGVDPTASTFRPEATKVSSHIDRLTNPGFVLIDQKSFPEFGPKNGTRFTSEDVGVSTEVQEKEIRIAGLFEMGSGLTANGAMIVNEQGFDRLLPFDSRNNVSMGLIKLKPGLTHSEKREIAERLQNRFRTTSGQVQVEVLTNREVTRRELHRWLGETPIGFIFQLGVLISLIVGAAIVYMILSTDVANKLGEYATLKAMGYTNGFLAWVVLKQALYLAVFAFIPSLLISLGLYAITASLAKIPIFMTPGRIVFVLIMSLLMCMVSGTFALKKLWQAEPAELF